MKSKLRIFVVLIILLGMPAFAWYFLQKGTSMRKSAMQNLEPKETLGQFETMTEKEQVVNPLSLKGKRWLIAILGTKDQRKASAELLLKLYKQSKDEFQANIFSLTGLDTGESMPFISQYLNLPSDDSHWLISYMSSDHLYAFSKEAFSIREQYVNKPCIILLDENLTIRSYYDISKELEVQKLVREYPVFLSLKNKK